MAYRFNDPATPVYAPNSYGGPAADTAQQDGKGWDAGGPMVRAAYTQHAQDDDWGQPGALVREVLDDDGRERLVSNVTGHLLNGVSEPVLARAFEYWTNIDPEIGKRIEESVHSQQADSAPTTSAGPTTPGDEAEKV